MPKPPEIWVSATEPGESGSFAVTYTFWDGERRTIAFLPDRYSKTEVDRVAQQLLAEKKERPF